MESPFLFTRFFALSSKFCCALVSFMGYLYMVKQAIATAPMIKRIAANMVTTNAVLIRSIDISLLVNLSNNESIRKYRQNI